MSFPTFKIGGLTLPRLLLGGNPISGFSHRSAEATTAMLDYFTVDRVKDLFRRCEACGIDEAAANAILVKVNQIGTLTETLDAVHLAQAGQVKAARKPCPDQSDSYGLHGLSERAPAHRSCLSRKTWMDARDRSVVLAVNSSRDG